MEEEKITLDRKTFKTLASDTRINILKSLDERRKTLSELSKQFHMSVSTISEHLGNLSDAELIVQRDEGHKWKYYELTRKGKTILYPDTRRIWIILGLSAFAVVILGFDMFRSLSGPALFSAPAQGARDLVTAPATEAAPLAANIAAEIPWLHIAGLALFAAILGISAFMLYRNRKPKMK